MVRSIITVTVNITPNVIMARMDIQYGIPITVFKATQGVNTVTPKLSKLRITYVPDARHRTKRDLNLKSKYWKRRKIKYN